MAPHPPPQQTSATRDQLRRDMLARRAALTPEQLDTLSAELSHHLTELLMRLAPRAIGFCWPWRGEFDARDTVTQWLAAGPARRAALPVITTPAAPMQFRAWQPHSVLEEGAFGIPVPRDGAWVVPDLFLMPVVAVDEAGFRLGYGGGYFDRTLAALTPRPLAVGVGFDFQRVASIAPQPWDEPLDWVVTERGASPTQPPTLGEQALEP